MFKRFFSFFIFCLVIACSKAEEVVIEENTKVDLVKITTNELKLEFVATFKNRFPRNILENISLNFEAFLTEAKVLLAKDAELLTLVDKQNLLPADHKPNDLILLKTNDAFTVSKDNMYASKKAVDALMKMSKVALKEGVTIVVSSAYRSYEYQKKLFARYVRDYGEAEATRFSARAGTSQHQLGTVFDFGSISDEWARTKAGVWVNKNASRFGFSLSFPQGYENVTGYKWECWHFRYIGLEACKMQRKWFDDIQQYMLEAFDFLLKKL